MQAGERQRKVRSDKKRDIKPTVAVQLKDSIYRLSFITTTAVKDVCEMLVVNAFENEAIIANVANYFQRDVRIGQTLFVGRLQNERIGRTIAGETDRISFRVKQNLYEKLYALSYALDCSVSRVASVLLYESMTDADFIEQYMARYVDSLDQSRKKELQQLLRYIRKETNEHYGFAELLSLLVDEPIKWMFPK